MGPKSPNPYNPDPDTLRKLLHARPGRQTDELLAPHEQDDPDLSSHDGTQIPYIGGLYPTTASGLVQTLIHRAPVPTQSSSIWGQSQRTMKTQIEGASPTAAFDITDDTVVLTMEGGREVAFASTNGMPVYVDGDQRTFRLTREEARVLTLQLARIMADHPED